MNEPTLEGIAVVGMAGRFPGAPSVDALWTNLLAGTESISFFSDAELAASGLDGAALRRGGHYVAARGVLAEADAFDAAFFGIPPREAEVMDPQQRVFLELCWTALEASGYAADRMAGLVGVFGGVSFNTYYRQVLHERPALRAQAGADMVMFGNERDYLATRVAYKLGLSGPAVSVSTACSTSLVAVCQACHALLAYGCDTALAGGASITVPQQRGYDYDEGSIGSSDGHTRTFDARSAGTVFSNGAGVVVLKRLEDAVRDRDHVYAVIKGAALNNDGAQRVSFGAPGVQGQSDVIAMAHALAGFDPQSITYVEAHGTATPLGDPIEVAALTKAFRLGTEARQFCAIGSIKTNIGHLDAASGVAGLIKTVLALHHRVIPASLHFTSANAALDLGASPFYVNAARQEWRAEEGVRRRAGVSSFGTGGTNAHVVLEEAPDAVAPGPSRTAQVLILSAATAAALERASDNLASYLCAHGVAAGEASAGAAGALLADTAFTLQVGRSELTHRRSLVCRDAADGGTALAARDPQRVVTHPPRSGVAALTFMFPGQGAQYAGMGAELYQSEAVFRSEVDRCAERLQPLLDLDLRAIVFAAGGATPDAEARLVQTRIAQPALFVVEYALARLWMSWGVTPAAMIGHSVGELVAACLAGVFTLEDALLLVARRGALIQALPSGAMLAVRMAEADLRPLLGDALAIAATNAPKLCTVSGPDDAVAALEAHLTARDIGARRLHTSHAFHSPMMTPMVAPLTALLRQMTLSEPRLPFMSSVTAGWITAAEATSPEYWGAHALETVRFADAVAALLIDPQRLLLEVGPGQTLRTLVHQQPSHRTGQWVLSSLPERGREVHGVLTALGALWTGGVTVDWAAVSQHESRRRVVLPTYPFERTRHWPAAETATATVEAQDPAKPAAAPADPPERNLESLNAPAKTVGLAVAQTRTRQERLGQEVRTALEQVSGLTLEGANSAAPFVALGLDSLLLTQVGARLRSDFGVRISFRQLMEELSCLDTLTAYLDQAMPADAAAAVAPVADPARTAAAGVPSARSVPTMHAAAPEQRTQRAAPGRSFTAAQQQWLDTLIARYTARTGASKQHTQTYRATLADPRSMAGFRAYWKEMVYPLVVERSAGSRMWDLDGNEYVDFTMGFGTNLFGHSPPFVTTAIEAQLRKGIEVGPQTPLAGQVAALMCELTGMERCAFANTGSEAVLAAIRVARTVTGRKRIVYFTGDYHGIFDEVLQRSVGGAGHEHLVPSAPGIPVQPSEHVLVLDYDTPASLDRIREAGADIAAVIVEPVQSRSPDLQPREFLRRLRDVTHEIGSALIFDEVITGFRSHPGGVQALFGVRADMATYGKVIGGGLPIGALCGSAGYLDALDGGAWRYGDCSIPESGVTFFAGTYVRHPLAIAAAWATLTHLKAEGPGLQERLNLRTGVLVREINAFLEQHGAPLHLAHFTSLFWVQIDPAATYGNLLFFLLRDKGIHIFEGRLFFLSTAHTEAELEQLVHAFKTSVRDMQTAGFLPRAASRPAASLSAPVLAQAEPIPATAVRIAAPPASLVRSSMPAPAATALAAMKFGLYLFGRSAAAFSPDKYQLLLDTAAFADQHRFSALWIPERHFNEVGGFSPNPVVLAAALAARTEHIHLRAGSVVLPLHHPIRVAEEWSMVDNLSKGRVGLSIASGWHPDDFVFAPAAYENRRELCTDGIATLRRLWSGASITARGGTGQELSVSLYPMPMQRTLPLWLTCVQAGSFEKAGELGVGVLAMLTNQSLDDVAEKIALYRRALAAHGHDPATGNVTVLVHTFVGADLDPVLRKARGPMREYLRSYLGNSQARHEASGRTGGADQQDVEYLLDRSFDDYMKGKALIGTPETCAPVIARLREIGVDEVGCFVDFGVDASSVLAGLPFLNQLKQRCEDTAATESLPPTAPVVLLAAPGRTAIAVPMTESQQGLSLLTRLAPAGNRAYAELTTLRLRGVLDADVLGRALQSIVDRHDALRTTIDPDGEQQTVQPEATLLLPTVDLSRTAPAERARCLERELVEIEAHAFDFSQAPALRARLIRLAADQHLLVLTFHHIFGNGPSYAVFFSELCDVYAGLTTGVAPTLEPALQLADYVAWRAQQPGTPEFARDRAFWHAQFADPLPVLDLPADHPRPPALTYRGARQSLTIDAALTARLRSVTASLRASLFMTLFTAFNVLLHRLSGARDVVVGVPFEGEARSLPGGERLFANTTNMIPLRTSMRRGDSFAALLAATRTRVLDANEHQSYFFGRLLQDLRVRPDLSRPPMFAAAFNLERGTFRRAVGALEIELAIDEVPFGSPRDTSKFELSFNIVDTGVDLRLDCDYSADLFLPSTVARWVGHYRQLLERIAGDPGAAIGRLALLTTAEYAQLATSVNETAVRFEGAATLHELFERQVDRTPDAIAVSSDGRALSYRELDARANQVAHSLHARGVGPECLVGICLERSLEMVIGLLGILKAGGAYVPIDPAYPQDRIAVMLADSAVTVLVTQAALLTRLPRVSAETICLDRDGAAIAAASRERPCVPVRAVHLAYMIYTSGSTGRPKGALNTHGAIVNRLEWMQREYRLSAGDAVLHKTPFSFDVSVWELFWPLMAGARMVVARPGGHQEPAYLVQLIVAEAITIAHFVPSMLRVFLETPGIGACVSLREVICSGEALAPDVVDACHAALPAALHNLYGPTEAAVDVTSWRCRRGEPRPIIPIGLPVANTRCYILDPELGVVPPGSSGELHLGGVQVGRGYHRQPALTAARFVPDPFGPEPGGRLYKTGDLCRYRADGAIEYLGRLDHQVKVRGFRIELGEIEAALVRHDAVTHCVVVVREHAAGDQRLVAYVEASSSRESLPDEWRAHLGALLPDYMVPSAFVRLPAIPLSPNGKIDRRALPAPSDMDDRAAAPVFEAPATDMAQRLAAIWRELLGVAVVGDRDDFFRLGGHSLLAMRLVNRVHQELGVALAPGALFEHPVLADLARHLDPRSGSLGAAVSQAAVAAAPTPPVRPSAPAPPKALIRMEPGGSGTPFFWVHGIGGEVFGYMSLSRHLAAERPVYGFAADWTTMAGFAGLTLDAIAVRYVQEMRDVQPTGPYHLGGLCAGAKLALEMARQLEAAGQHVGVLAAIDCDLEPISSSPSVLAAVGAFLGNAPHWLREDAMASGGRELVGRVGSKLRTVLGRSRLLRSATTASGARQVDLRDQLGMWRFPAHQVGMLTLHHQAIDGYEAQPFDGKATVFIPHTAPLFGPWPRSYDATWDRLARGGVELHRVRGSHSTMMSNPFAADLASRLNASIRAAEATTDSGRTTQRA